ncbi:MAG TPA: hypothetical protein IAC14_12755 [Candidatus Scybalomonas excrementigallinarum]|nr:hypothetical protein [Candidatus Scybalomonas excrementigallinarum]
MNSNYILEVGRDFIPDPEESVMKSLFREYESVLMESLITSFGLDFFIKDQHGGDVDTLHNVRQVGKDERMTYKNKKNEEAYYNRGAYDSKEYHQDKRYQKKRREYNKKAENGTLVDEYTKKKMGAGEKGDLDHVISAKEIHDDPARVLAGLKGTDLANCDENLKITNSHTNRSKKDLSMEEYLKKHGDQYTEREKENMKNIDKKTRRHYERLLMKKYYLNKGFLSDTVMAASSTSIKMGVRQAVGFVFLEVWYVVKEEFLAIQHPFDIQQFLERIGQAVKRGFQNAKKKYGEVIEKFKQGALAGFFSSITTTLTNIFFTTAKNVVKIIRQTSVSIVEAGKILLFNPDNLSFQERMVAVAKILATGASVVVGSLVGEAISLTPIGNIPIVGEIVQTFCGTFVTGVMSCTMLYLMENSKCMNFLVYYSSIFSQNVQADYFRQQAQYFENYAIKLMRIDKEAFKKEAYTYQSIVRKMRGIEDADELNLFLKKELKGLGGNLPWEGEFDSFMKDKESILVFE